MKGTYVRAAAVCLFVVLVITLEIRIHVKLRKIDTTAYDVYYAWVEGQRILAGENPYERVLSGDMKYNDKYATYFPLFYELSALAQAAGLWEYPEWIAFWKIVFSLFRLATAFLLFNEFYRRKLFALAIFASSFWLFNVWALYVLMIAHIDFIPIFFLVLSLLIFRRHRLASYLLFGLSLAIKQIAIFLFPLYLIWAWQSSETKAIREVLVATVSIMIIPLLTSVPFIIWNAEGFFKSVLFSATRAPGGNLGAVTINVFLGLRRIFGRLPMIGMMAFIYYFAGKRRIGMYLSAFLVMVVFVTFNPVFFNHYLIWVAALLPLSLCELVRPGATRDKAETSCGHAAA